MKKPNTHIIAAISFPPRHNDGPLSCSCGEQMLASQFADHRKALNAPTGTSQSDLPKAFSLWRRSDGTEGRHAGEKARKPVKR